MYLSAVTEYLGLPSSTLSITHHCYGPSVSLVPVSFFQGSHAFISWSVTTPPLPWLYGVKVNDSNLAIHANSSALTSHTGNTFTSNIQIVTNGACNLCLLCLCDL